MPGGWVTKRACCFFYLICAVGVLRNMRGHRTPGRCALSQGIGLPSGCESATSLTLAMRSKPSRASQGARPLGASKEVATPEGVAVGVMPAVAAASLPPWSPGPALSPLAFVSGESRRTSKETSLASSLHCAPPTVSTSCQEHQRKLTSSNFRGSHST